MTQPYINVRVILKKRNANNNAGLIIVRDEARNKKRREAERGANASTTGYDCPEMSNLTFGKSVTRLEHCTS